MSPFISNETNETNEATNPNPTELNMMNFNPAELLENMQSLMSQLNCNENCNENYKFNT